MSKPTHKPAVAFFGFNRPDCSRIVFEEIRRYRPEKLLLVADGPRAHVPTDAARCAAVREIMTAVDWDCEVKTNFSEKNLGCKTRMSSGVDWVFSEVEEAILLEDDCVPSADFFSFCAEMLERYRNDPRVMHIGGYNVQKGQVRGNASYYFSRFIHIWGWASWRRAWRSYDVSLKSWPEVKDSAWPTQFFSSPQDRQYWSHLFSEVQAGKIDTWDYQWVYACWRNNGLSITPNANLISNIGAGPDATHTKGPVGSLEAAIGTLGKMRHPSSVAVNHAADQFTLDDHYGLNRPSSQKSLYRRAREKLSRLKHQFGLTHLTG